jgi:prefoldin subunit 5
MEEVRAEAEMQAVEREIKELKMQATTQEIDRQTAEINQLITEVRESIANLKLQEDYLGDAQLLLNHTL